MNGGLNLLLQANAMRQVNETTKKKLIVSESLAIDLLGKKDWLHSATTNCYLVNRINKLAEFIYKHYDKSDQIVLVENKNDAGPNRRKQYEDYLIIGRSLNGRIHWAALRK